MEGWIWINVGGEFIFFLFLNLIRDSITILREFTVLPKNKKSRT